ncbi:MAG: SDR family oxidoreductase [Oligosphaeraceae bacterium]|nr:SDR family oxidoreductase [Oligosphaeraceae bacterium]
MNVMQSFSLENKSALVTGGAGRYGKQISEALAEAGALVYIASRDLARCEEFAAELRGRGLQAKALQLDLASEESMQQVMKEIEDDSGGLDILVNNAVIRCALNGWDQTLEAFDRSLHVNASALFYLTNLAAKQMRQRGGGSIINIGSMMGLVGIETDNYQGTDMNPNPSPIYFYEKGGMVNFTRFAASCFGKHNIRVNCIHPGGLQEDTLPAAFVANYSRRTQLGRLGNQNDLKGIVVLLASQASSYITGTNIPVDGGYTAK